MTAHPGKHTAATTLSFILGVGAGIAAGMLLAPRSGRESRAQIRQRALEMKDKAEAKMAHEKQMLKAKAADVADKAQGALHKGEAKIDEAKVRTRAM